MKYGRPQYFFHNYGTIPQAERQEKEASFCLGGASFSVSLPGVDGPSLLLTDASGGRADLSKVTPTTLMD